MPTRPGRAGGRGGGDVWHEKKSKQQREGKPAGRILLLSSEGKTLAFKNQKGEVATSMA